jgi:hypothetical protein
MALNAPSPVSRFKHQPAWSATDATLRAYSVAKKFS